MLNVKSIIGILSLVFFFSSFSARAQDAYFGASYTDLDYSEGGSDLGLQALTGRLGKNFSEYVSGEFRYALGFGGDSVSFEGLNFEVDLENFYGGYLRGGFQASDSFFVYGLLGYTRIEISASVTNFGSSSSAENDISFGIGVDLNISGNAAFNFEYTNYYDKDGAEISGPSIGFISRF